ncbi:MAG TPA: DMT family transporter, partial [Massilibacterium sp.]|nr:DMT family transporter [Massilibacterium sp.]
MQQLWKGKNQQTFATINLIIAMTIFGSIGFVSAKTGLLSFELVFVRCIGATVFLGFGWFLSGQFKREEWNKKEITYILICGILLVFNWIFLFKAFETMAVTIAISIYYLAPILVLLMGSIIYRESLTIMSVISIIVCFIGLVFITGIDSITSFDKWLSSGVIWALLAALFYALTTLVGKGITKTSPYAVTFLQTFMGIFILIPFVNFHAFTNLNEQNWLAIVLIGAVHTGFVYYLFFGSLRHLPTRLISALVFLD